MDTTTSTTTDEAIRREILDQLRDHEHGGALRDGLERMRRFFGWSWMVVHEAYMTPGTDPSKKLAEWRRAPEGSREALKAAEHDRAVDFLTMWAVLRRDG